MDIFQDVASPVLLYVFLIAVFQLVISFLCRYIHWLSSSLLFVLSTLSLHVFTLYTLPASLSPFHLVLLFFFLFVIVIIQA